MSEIKAQFTDLEQTSGMTAENLIFLATPPPIILVVVARLCEEAL